MRKFRFLMPVGFLLMAAAFSAGVMLLWNWLMPVIFGLAVINFWQALGLLVLSRILFGGFGFGRNKMMMGGRMKKNPIREGWMKMSPEQREEFIKRRRQFGHGHPFDRDFFEMKEHSSNKKDE